MQTRTRIDLINSWPKWSRIAELGVFKGEFSQEIINRCDPREMFMVDMFHGNYQSNNLWANMEEEYERLCKLHAGNSGVHIVRSDSMRWLCGLPRDFLDIVYIDSDHTYESTLIELVASHSAVRPGGLICGHDYVNQWGVIRAVNTFCHRFGLLADIWATENYPSFSILNSR